MRGPVVILLLCLTLPLPAAAAGPDEGTEAARRTFSEANDAFLSGEPEQALGLYRELVQAGYGTADVQFNLGNAALESGRLGEAVVAYERALRQDPRHAGARANLRIAQARNVDQVRGGGAPSFLERLARVLPVRPLAVGFLVAWLGLFGTWLLRRLLGGASLLTGIMAVLATGSLVLGVLLAGVVWVREARQDAVVMVETVPVREGPAPRFRAAFEVHEGLRVRWLDTQGPYVRIRLANGLDGWVERKSLEPI